MLAASSLITGTTAGRDSERRDFEQRESDKQGPSKSGTKLLKTLTSLRLAMMKVGLILLSCFANTQIIYLVLGMANRRFHFLSSVFMCYAGNPNYAKHYTFEATIDWFKWQANPIGLMKQGSKWGLVIGTPMTEADFTDPKNADKLARLLKKLRRIARFIGVEQISLSGILPSYLLNNHYELKMGDNSVPATVVYRALLQLEHKEDLPDSTPIILLGGNGSVGTHIQVLLEEAGRSFCVVDPNNGLSQLPEDLMSKPCVLIDVSRRNVLARYADSLWPQLILLNETYPEPPKKLIAALRHRGVKCFHVSGVKGSVYPPLPQGYQGSVPCCAIHDASDDALTPVLLSLS